MCFRVISSSLMFSMTNTIWPYLPLSTLNSITPLSSAMGSEVTFIPFLSKISSGLYEKRECLVSNIKPSLIRKVFFIHLRHSRISDREKL